MSESVAVDVGSYSIKIVSVKRKGKALEVQRVIEAPNYLGVSLPADEAGKEKLATQLQALFTDNSLPTQDVRLALPESVVSTKVIQVPLLTDAELASAIGWQAEQFIPIPKDELSLEYQVLFRPEKKDRETPMRVLLVGVRRQIVEEYTNIFQAIAIEPTFIETQTLALWRTIHPAQNDATSMAAHMGLSTMDLSIERAGELVSVFSHAQGGLLLTRAIENALALPLQQSEEYKRTYGLNQQYFEGKVYASLQPVVQSVVEQMKKAMQFFSTQYPQESVARVYLSGGAAQLPELVSYVASALGLEVLLLNPFSQATGAVPDANQLAYSICMGLLYREE